MQYYYEDDTSVPTVKVERNVCALPSYTEECIVRARTCVYPFRTSMQQFCYSLVWFCHVSVCGPVYHRGRRFKINDDALVIK